MSHASASKKAASSGSGEIARSQRPLTPGVVLEGRYQIQKVIGRGGMSTVYAARDLRFGQVERLTAIKEMVDSDPDPGTRALRLVNFERESALLATIAHSAVPKIYDYFSQAGLVYLVLEYIDGQDLERALLARKKPFPEADTLRWTIEICSVLDMLHENDPDPIIFRDLKPSNIMLRSNGHIALIDFGIARMFQGKQRGTMIGTEGYAPPEQYRGIADARGDVYALGATLHHLATNSDPRQETPFTFHDRPVRSINPDLSDEFANIISRMVAYHPDQRYQTVAEISADVQRLLARRERPQMTVFQGQPRSEEQPEPPSPPQTTVFTGPIPVAPVASGRFERRRSSRKRAGLRNTARAASLERIAWSVQTTDEVRGSATVWNDLALIGSYDNYVYAVDPGDGSVRWKFPTGGGVVARPAVHEGMVVIGSEDGSVYGVDAESGAMAWACRTGRPVRSSCLIAGDRGIVGSDDGSIYCVDVASGEILWRHRSWGPVRSSAALKDDVIYIGGDDGYLDSLAVEDGSTLWRQPCGGPVRSIPAIDGERVIITTWHGMVASFAAKTGVRIWQRSMEAPIVSSPVVREDVAVLGISDGALIGISTADGSQTWSIRYANQVTSTALLGASIGFVGTVDGGCLAFDVQSGELAWRHQIGGPIVSTPVLAGDVLIVGSLDSNIYGIALTDTELRDLQEG